MTPPEEIILAHWNPTGKAIASEAYLDKVNKTNYAPVCINKFDKKAGCKIKKGVKNPCKNCSARKYAPLDLKIIQAHINGDMRKGIYPLLQGNITAWVASDLDNHDGTRDPCSDVKKLAEVSLHLNIPLRVFSSSSGKGYHAYIFFDKPIKAYKARHLMKGVLDRSDIGQSDSFDRMFPVQDTLQGLDIGNLIALPWSGEAMKNRRTTMWLNSYSLDPHGDSFKENIDLFEQEFEALTDNDVDMLLEEMGVEASAPKTRTVKSADTSAFNFIELCNFLTHCKNNATILDEPKWYLMICILAREFGGPALIHAMSKDYQGYDVAETDAKIVHALNDQPGPITCATIKKEWDCGKDCGVACPIHLKQKRKEATKQPEWVNEILWGVPQGRRKDACAKLAGYYIDDFDGDIPLTMDALTGWNTRNTPPLTQEELAEIADEASGRQGMAKLSKLVGRSISQIEILKYPDGTVKYNLYVKEYDNYIQLDPVDLVGHRKFRVIFMTLTRKVMSPVKDTTWFPVVEQALFEAREVYMDESETSISTIKLAVRRDLGKNNNIELPDPEAHIESGAVLYAGKVHVYLHVVAKRLQVAGIRVNSQKDIGKLMRMIGFKNQSVTMNGKRLRTWNMESDKFLSFFS